MINMQIKAPEDYNKSTGKIEERNDIIDIILDGDTYQVKEKIKEFKFEWVDFANQWEYTVSREWFKINGYNFVRSVAKEFKCRPNIIGDQAKIAVQTMSK